VVPVTASLGVEWVERVAVLVFFPTKAQASSGWICLGWMLRTIESWNNSACLPKRAVKRRTVLRVVPHSRAVARQPTPSARWRAMAIRVCSEVRRPNRGVLARWEKCPQQVVQRRQRTLLSLVDHPCGRRLPAPRRP
jgi:hypothetical protein